MTEAEVHSTIADYEQGYGKPTTYVLLDGRDKLVGVIRKMLENKN